ncbi:hypothetical protein [Gulosibacter molinativorax]|nr:hypothetical protein [Gulosibacter molinativorax]
MTTTAPNNLADRILNTDAKLYETLSLIFDTPDERAVWIFFLDEDHRVTGPVMPLENYPATPNTLVDEPPFGRVRFASALASRLGDMLDFVEGSTLVLVWEDTDAGDPDTIEWARALAIAAKEAEVSLRAQFALNRHGFWQITPDDLA